MFEKTKINGKEAGDGPILKNARGRAVALSGVYLAVIMDPFSPK